MSGPDLFVVCKSCGAEVSPYITECPYCGKRLRKRAPNLDKPVKPPRRVRPSGGTRAAPKPPRERRIRAGRASDPYAPTRRPWGTIALVVAAIVLVVGGKSGLWSYDRLLASDFASMSSEPWRYVTTLFVYGSTGYEVVALSAVFLFGWLLERRHGLWAPVLVFLAAGGLGVLAAIALEDVVVLVGANGAALGLLTAWAVEALPEDDEDHDRLGLIAAAAVLAALPLAVREADAVAGVVGAAVGALLGLALRRARTH